MIPISELLSAAVSPSVFAAPAKKRILSAEIPCFFSIFNLLCGFYNEVVFNPGNTLFMMKDHRRIYGFHTCRQENA